MTKEFDKDREVFRFGLPIPIDRDYRNGGWSSPEYYPIVRAAWKRGAIKLVDADITIGGISFGLQVARAIRIPIKLIHLSNIFDYKGNWDSFDNLRRRVNEGLTEHLISADAQVVTATIVRDLETEVYPIREYFSKHPVYDYKSFTSKWFIVTMNKTFSLWDRSQKSNKQSLRSSILGSNIIPDGGMSSVLPSK